VSLRKKSKKVVPSLEKKKKKKKKRDKNSHSLSSAVVVCVSLAHLFYALWFSSFLSLSSSLSLLLVFVCLHDA